MVNALLLALAQASKTAPSMAQISSSSNASSAVLSLNGFVGAIRTSANPVTNGKLTVIMCREKPKMSYPNVRDLGAVH